MQRRVPLFARRCGCHLRLSRGACAMVTSAHVSLTRAFVQGAPPTPKDIDKNRKRYLRSSHKDEMESQYKRRQQEIHEYFAATDPNSPEPLEENAFVKGKFGMRRRYLVDHRDKINSFALNDAMAESIHAMRK